eukprot:gene16465-16644_t
MLNIDPKLPMGTQVYGAIRHSILNLSLAPKQALSEKELSLVLGVSRTPVREALIKLAEDGLVDVLPQRGTFVAPIRMTEVLEAQFIREALEVAVVRKVAALCDENITVWLHDSLVRQKRAVIANSPADFLSEDEAFHFGLTKFVNLPRAWKVIQNVKGQLDRVRVLSLPEPGQLGDLYEQHARIVHAIKAHDANAAQQQMTHHLQQTGPLRLNQLFKSNLIIHALSSQYYMSKQKTFLSIGECMVELASTAAGQYDQKFAGDTLNTAYYARHYLPRSWQVEYFTAVGDDDISADMLAFFASKNIGSAYVRRVPDRSVGLYMIRLTNGERHFSYWRSQSAPKTLADDPAALDMALAKADVIFFSGITLAILPEPAIATFLRALCTARKAGKTIAFDTNIRPSLWPDPATMNDVLMQGAAAADIILPSFDDEAMHFGDKNPEATLARYKAAGCSVIVVKNGAGNVLLSGGDDTTSIRPPRVPQIIDTTSAGDSFNGTFLAQYIIGGDARLAAQAAAQAASVVIGHHGALIDTTLLPQFG